ncbi:hypothetical protein J14TS2_42550 [Bacillus sp. J14TS2]|uniref:alcohol dehydrogenase catalytic domain-containing protein n=1 Tax=Bacillus sp. J14TS2 TaxID=2807188 RepID=UPI001B20720F|nr:alcohol dehydrogenase catalytic domain-containing protein [Bacillus sp. J14TS2]GIN73780.1 hypothetical protein J14TS2_42550 [Bacillus sp. J14TS2]
MKPVEIPIPELKEEKVLIRAEGCGVCHGDVMTSEGETTSYLCIPGHEVVGNI